jgi:pimeloyl-ACP methyl ester carboxylesterase
MVVLGVIEEHHQNQGGQHKAGDEVRHNAARLRFCHLGQAQSISIVTEALATISCHTKSSSGMCGLLSGDNAFSPNTIAGDVIAWRRRIFRLTKDLMWDNRLFNDTMSAGGRAAKLENIKVPLLHAVAEHDHIVPYDAAKHLIAKVGSQDREEVMMKGGHVPLVAGANAIKRLWPKLDSWLSKRST